MVGGLFAFGIFSLVLLLWQENRNTAPLIPPRLFKEPSIWRSDGLAACHGAALVSLLTFLPIYLRAVRGASPAETGLMLLPLTFGIGIGSIITGQFVTRSGRTAVFPTYGLLAATAGLVAIAFSIAHLSTTAMPWAFGIVTLCMGTVMGVVQITVQTVAGPAHAWYRRGDGAVLPLGRRRGWHRGRCSRPVFLSRACRPANRKFVWCDHRPGT